MDTRQLAAFCEVVERHSFSEAAARLGVTQPAVSQQVRSLEQRLGTQLLDRSGRRVEPTEAGLRLYRGAQRMLALEEQLLEEVGRAGRAAHGHARDRRLDRARPRSYCRSCSASSSARTRSCTSSSSVFDTQSIVELVAERRLELGIVGAARRHRSVAFEPFFRDEVILACPPRHPFAGKTVELERSGEGPADPDAARAPASGRWSRTSCARRGRRLRDLDAPLELGLQESVRSAVQAGYGVGFISRRAVESELAAGALAEARVRGLDLEPRHLDRTRRPAAPARRAAQAFLAFAREKTATVIVRWGLEELPAVLGRHRHRRGRCSSPARAGTRWRSRPRHAGARFRPTGSPSRRTSTGSSPSAAAARSTPRRRPPRRRDCRSSPSRPRTRAPSGRASSASGRPTVARSAADPAPGSPGSSTTPSSRSTCRGRRAAGRR